MLDDNFHAVVFIGTHESLNRIKRSSLKSSCFVIIDCTELGGITKGCSTIAEYLNTCHFWKYNTVYLFFRDTHVYSIRKSYFKRTRFISFYDHTQVTLLHVCAHFTPCTLQ